MGAVAFPRPSWEWVVCDLTGAPISNLTTLGHENTWTFRRNRPAVVTLRVAADDPRVNLNHTDGRPYVTKNLRLLKGYRGLAGQAKTLRFAGPILQVGKDGGGDQCQLTLTAFSAEQRLYTRLCRRTSIDDVTTGVGRVDTCKFTSKTGDQILKALVDQTIASAGALPLDTGGSFATTSALTLQCEEGMKVGDSHERITGTNTVDAIWTPIDGLGPVVVRMSVAAAMGSDKPNAIFGYATDPRNVQAIQSLDDGTETANDVRVAGGRPQKGATWTYGHATDAASLAAMGRYESWDTADPVVTDTVFLNDLAVAELALRKNGRFTLTIVPNPEQAPRPWDDYFCGDTVHYWQGVNAGEKLQNQSIFVEQIEGAMDEQGYERVTAIKGRASV